MLDQGWRGASHPTSFGSEQAFREGSLIIDPMADTAKSGFGSCPKAWGLKFRTTSHAGVTVKETQELTSRILHPSVGKLKIFPVGVHLSV